MICQCITVRRQHNHTIGKLSVSNNRPEQLSSDYRPIRQYDGTIILTLSLLLLLFLLLSITHLCTVEDSNPSDNDQSGRAKHHDCTVQNSIQISLYALHYMITANAAIQVTTKNVHWRHSACGQSLTCDMSACPTLCVGRRRRPQSK